MCYEARARSHHRHCPVRLAAQALGHPGWLLLQCLCRLAMEARQWAALIAATFSPQVALVCREILGRDVLL